MVIAGPKGTTEQDSLPYPWCDYDVPDRLERLYAPLGGFRKAVRMYVEEGYYLHQIAEIISHSPQSVSLHFIRVFGRPPSTLKIKKQKPSQLGNISEVLQACKVSNRPHAQNISKILSSLFGESKRFFISISPDFMRVRIKEINDDITIYIKITATNPVKLKNDSFVRFDITPYMRNFDFTFFFAIDSAGEMTLYTFNKQELPNIQTLALHPTNNSDHYKYASHRREISHVTVNEMLTEYKNGTQRDKI